MQRQNLIKDFITAESIYKIQQKLYVYISLFYKSGFQFFVTSF